METTSRDKVMLLEFIKTIYPDSKVEDMIGEWGDYLKYEVKDHIDNKVIFAGPSHIIGLLVSDRFEPNGEWKDYSLVRKLSSIKKELVEQSLFYFNDHFFSSRILIDCLIKLFKDKEFFEIKDFVSNDIGVIMFRIDDRYSFGIAEVLTEEYKVENDVVTFTEVEIGEEDDKYVSTGKVLKSKFENGIAKFKVIYGSRSWHNYVLDKSYLFELEEDEGDFCAI